MRIGELLKRRNPPFGRTSGVGETAIINATGSGCAAVRGDASSAMHGARPDPIFPLLITILLLSVLCPSAFAQQKGIADGGTGLIDNEAAAAIEQRIADLEVIQAAHGKDLSDEERAALMEAIARLHGQHGAPVKRPEPVVAVSADVGLKKTEKADAAHTYDLIVAAKDAEDKPTTATVEVVVADKEAQKAVDAALDAIYKGDYVPKERLTAANKQAADATAWGAALAKKGAGKDKTLARQRAQIIALNRDLADALRRAKAAQDLAAAPRKRR
jgi:hypothetical protein